MFCCLRSLHFMSTLIREKVSAIKISWNVNMSNNKTIVKLKLISLNWILNYEYKRVGMGLFLSWKWYNVNFIEACSPFEVLFRILRMSACGEFISTQLLAIELCSRRANFTQQYLAYVVKAAAFRESPRDQIASVLCITDKCFVSLLYTYPIEKSRLFITFA